MTQELMGLHEVRTLLAVSQQRAGQIVQKPDFPTPVTHLACGRIWDGDAIRTWIAAWRRAAGRPKSSATDTAMKVD
jgi:hypothetical protein